MARGTTLEELVTKLRAEARHSLDDSQGRYALPGLKLLLARVQATLYEDHEWPFLQVKRDIPLQAGQRYYDFPNDLDMGRALEIKVKDGGRWEPVKYGITDDLYGVYDSDLANEDLGQRSDPVRSWGLYAGEEDAPEEQIEVWPVPATDQDDTTKDGTLRIRGTKKLSPLVESTDRAVLDDELIVLFAAAEVLADQKADSAPAKLAAAKALYEKLKANQSFENSPAFSWLGGARDPAERDANGHVVITVRGT